MNAKKVLSLLLALVMALSLVACGEKEPDDKQPDAEVKYKECFVIGNGSTLSETDPMNNNSTQNRQIYEMTHNTLVNYNLNTGEISAGLAKDWDVSDDGLVYTFYLEEGVTFHNGEPCTAEDVVFSFNRARESATLKASLKAIESVEAVDEHTVKMTLSVNNVEFLIALTNNSVVVLSEAALAADPEKGGMIGTGPFMMTEWIPKDYVLLTRYEDYFGELPKSKQIKFRSIPEGSARVIALQNGEIDLCLELPAAEAAHVSDTAGCKLLQMPSTKMVYAAMNISGYNQDVLDVRVRQALNYATNPADIITVMTEGYGQPCNGVIAPALWGYSDSVKAYTYDVEKAKQLLAEAGYNESNPLEISFSYSAKSFPGMFEVLQAQWAKAGVNLTLSADTSAVYKPQLTDLTYDIYQTNCLCTSIGDINVFWHSTSASNRTRTADPELDKMLEEALTITDKEERLAKYAVISQHLTDNASMIPLYIETLLIGMGDSVDGLELYGNGRHVFSYAYAVE